ncbi:efflux RND transporter periplasmic adaptor subunit [Montanilutibacter psychrotolerans]|uniref:Efflux RND transporter periplasmic adaptor subunit n=1 Tax=Montanilutibacter psychrotolerans TaxID=1327343 RepID=A0A3M8SX56_9GAMM|nr:efflux RND transporter periplasmic adaptor subunit [Lysobacter psychrotolerans]RNF85941.1 efflux RND transporter periplasmic adaptor subunit [Lysobacter psychrotolerans]
MRINPLPAVACSLLLSVLLSACGGDATPKSAGGADRPTAVTTTVLQPRPWSDTVQALGTVRAREAVTVTAKVSEIVQRVHFESGDVVAAGAPLLTLSGQAQQAELQAAQAAANEADRLYARQSELAAQQLIARSALDTQRAARDATNAKVAQIRASLGDRVIRAPFAGVLGLRQVSPGSLVTPGTPIATLDDIARVFADFPVPEAMLAHVAPGQSLAATSTAFPGRRFEGTVSVIDARLDEATRALTVRGDFANADRALRPGMLLQVTLSRPERPALLLPEIAIVQVGNDAYVFRVKPDGSSVERVDVRVGTRRDGLAEVVDGVKAGDRIVVDGTGKLRPGAKVEEKAADTARAAAPAAGPRK